MTIAALLISWVLFAPMRDSYEALIIGGGTAGLSAALDGSREECDGIFLSAPLRARHPLVDQLGARVRGDGEIEIDERGRTCVAGVYAAGDAVTTVHQVVLAAASGVCAAMALNEDGIKEQVRQLPARA